MRKLLIVAEMRSLEKQVHLGEISYSRMIEIINEKADEYANQKNSLKTLQEHQTVDKLAREYANIKHDRPIDYEERYFKDYQKYDGFIAGYNSRQSEVTELKEVLRLSEANYVGKNAELTKEIEELKYEKESLKQSIYSYRQDIEKLNVGIKEAVEAFEGEGVLNTTWLLNHLIKLTNH
jgi:chromosome segregation ATPase